MASAGYRTLSLDHRGHGESDWVANGDYGLDRFALDAQIVTQQFAEPPVLVGASLGGLTAMVLEGIIAPGSCAAVVLVDIVPDMDLEGVQRIKDFMADRLDEGFVSLEEAAEAVAAYNPHRTKAVDPEGLRKNLRLGEDGRWRWHWDPEFMRPAFRDVGRSDFYDLDRLHDAVAAIEVPIQLVRGQLSDIVSETGAAEFLARFPHVEFVDVSDASHMVAGDRNDVFTDAVVQFLTKL